MEHCERASDRSIIHVPSRYNSSIHWIKLWPNDWEPTASARDFSSLVSMVWVFDAHIDVHPRDSKSAITFFFCHQVVGYNIIYHDIPWYTTVLGLWKYLWITYDKKPSINSKSKGANDVICVIPGSNWSRWLKSLILHGFIWIQWMDPEFCQTASTTTGWWLNLPLWNMMEFVTGDDDIANMMGKKKTCSKPTTRLF